MKDPVLHVIMESCARQLQNAFGYCGVADGDTQAFLHSGPEGKNFKIIIKDEDD